MEPCENFFLRIAGQNAYGFIRLYGLLNQSLFHVRPVASLLNLHAGKTKVHTQPMKPKASMRPMTAPVTL